MIDIQRITNYSSGWLTATADFSRYHKIGLLMVYLLSALLGLLSGALGSLIAPWVHWGIEKRRDKRNARRDLALNAREYIASKSFSAFYFYQETYFIRLKPYIDKKVIDWVENFEKYYDAVEDPSNLQEDLKVELLKQLQRIEKKWGLI
jgi:hypothetical protein